MKKRDENLVSLTITDTPDGVRGVILKAEQGESLWVVESAATFKVAASADGALLDADEFKEAFKTAAERAKITSASISVVLTGKDVTVSILDFAEGLPPKKSDAMELVRWRAAKALFLKPSQCRVDYVVLKNDGQGVRVLTATLKQTVADFYENVFDGGEEGFDFTLKKIGLSSLGILNLLTDKLSQDEVAKKDCVLIVRTAVGFTLMAFTGGVLAFYRSKIVDSTESFLTEVSSSLLYLSEMESVIDVSKVYFVGIGDEGLKEALDAPVEVVDISTLILSGALSVTGAANDGDELTSMDIISAVGGLS